MIKPITTLVELYSQITDGSRVSQNKVTITQEEYEAIKPYFVHSEMSPKKEIKIVFGYDLTVSN